VWFCGRGKIELTSQLDRDRFLFRQLSGSDDALECQNIGTKKLSEAVNGVLRQQIPFEPATLNAVGCANGHEVCAFALKTAAAAKRIELLPDTTQFHADDKDACRAEFRMVDENGVRVPNAEPEVTFETTGPATIIGIGIGDLNNVEYCKTNQHRAFQSRGLAILRAAAVPGAVHLKASSPGLDSTLVVLPSR
jgi:beta-galactosidase